MGRIIADSSCLILLAKCGFLELVCRRYELVVPPAVANEVASESLVKIYPDAALLLRLINEVLIAVRKPGVAHLETPISLHQGEEQALILAKELGDAMLATDDGKAVKAARFLRIPFIISPRIVTELFRQDAITLRDARRSLEKLARIGRYSPQIIGDALLSLLEENDGKADNNKDT